MNKILIVDIETTGFLKQGGSIVEIGISSLCLDTGVIEIVYDEVCKEDIFSPKHTQKPYGWIFKNSDLTLFHVLCGKPFDAVKEEVQAIINKYPLGITAYNKKFDFDFLRNRGIKIGKELPCLMKACTNVCKIGKKYQRGYKWPSFEEAFKYFFPDVEYKEAHRGGDDSYYEAMMAYKLVKRGVIKIDKLSMLRYGCANCGNKCLTSQKPDNSICGGCDNPNWKLSEYQESYKTNKDERE